MSDRPKSLRDKQLILAYVWLDGFYRENKQGVPRKAYLLDKSSRGKHGKIDDDKCRKALASILSRGTTPKRICDLLAKLIVPDGDPKAGDRKMVLQFRKRGERTDAMRDSAIVTRVRIAAETFGGAGKIGKAQRKVAKDVGLGFDAVKAIWRRYKWARDAKVV